MSRPSHDVVIVGGGLFGLVFAQQIATRTPARVLLLEATDHLGGLAWSRRDPVTGVEYNPHGTHVLSTSDPRVLSYLAGFTGFLDYRHAVYAQTGSQLVAMPVALEAIRACYGSDLDPDEARAVVRRDTAPFRDRPVRSAADAARADLGHRLYETFVAGYIRKQWDADPEQLAPEVFTSRFKIRYQKGSTYFPASSRQALPVSGYSGLCAALSEHERIDVELGVHASYRSLPRFGRLCLVTAPIDVFFDNRFGVLERRHIAVDWGYRPAAEAPTAAVITYPEPAVGHYRTHVPAFLPWNDPVPANQVPTGTVLVGFEHSGTGEHTTSFVTRTAANAAVAEHYRQAVRRLPGFIFGGRGTTFYDDMATTIATSLMAADAAVAQLDAVRR